MRKHGRTDANQSETIKYLRSAGVSVAITSDVGNGFVDFVCGYKGNNYLFELKDRDKPPSARKLTKDEKIFHDNWRGQSAVVLDALGCMRIMGMI